MNNNTKNTEFVNVLQTQYGPVYTMPLIGEPAPPFKAQSTKGEINFPKDYKGKWVLFFSYPGDYCASCTTELIELAKNKDIYEELGVEILGLSIDSLFSHVSWLESINRLNYDDVENVKVEFPLISDSTMEISKKYGLLRRGETDTESVRGGFLVDPKGIIRAIQIYPRQVGRGGEEIIRAVKAIQKWENEDVYTPANWQPGDDVLLPKPESLDAALKTKDYKAVDGDIFCPDWYLCFKKDKPENKQTDNEQNNNFNNDDNTKITTPYTYFNTKKF